MNIQQIIRENYDISNITKIEKTKFGSGHTYEMTADKITYLVKLNNKIKEIELYYKIQNVFEESNLLHPKIQKTASNELMGPDGIVLFEYIDGETLEYFDSEMTNKAIDTIKDYNKTLKKVIYNESDLTVENDWDKVANLDYLLYEVYDRVETIEIDKKWKLILFDSIEILLKNKKMLENMEVQLIHSDLGADNFIIKKNEIVSIIDFSPEYNNELYSLAQFLFWNYLWRNEKREKSVAYSYLDTYLEYSASASERKLFYLMIIRAAIFRVVGPLFELNKRENKDFLN